MTTNTINLSTSFKTLEIPPQIMSQAMIHAIQGKHNQALQLFEGQGLNTTQISKIDAIFKNFTPGNPFVDLQRLQYAITEALNSQAIDSTLPNSPSFAAENGASIFSNSFPCNFEFGGTWYTNSLSCFLAQQYTDQPKIMQLFSLIDPKAALALARQHPMTQERKLSWENPEQKYINKNDVLMRVQRAKFGQNPELIQQLVDTNNSYLLCTGNDWFFSKNIYGRGLNWLGECLMSLRQECGGVGAVQAPENTFLPSVLGLPKEVEKIIFNHFDHSEWGLLRRTSKAWKDFFNNHFKETIFQPHPLLLPHVPSDTDPICNQWFFKPLRPEEISIEQFKMVLPAVFQLTPPNYWGRILEDVQGTGHLTLKGRLWETKESLSLFLELTPFLYSRLKSERTRCLHDIEKIDSSYTPIFNTLKNWKTALNGIRRLKGWEDIHYSEMRVKLTNIIDLCIQVEGLSEKAFINKFGRESYIGVFEYTELLPHDFKIYEWIKRISKLPDPQNIVENIQTQCNKSIVNVFKEETVNNEISALTPFLPISSNLLKNDTEINQIIDLCINNNKQKKILEDYYSNPQQKAKAQDTLIEIKNKLNVLSIHKINYVHLYLKFYQSLNNGCAHANYLEERLRDGQDINNIFKNSWMMRPNM